MVPSGDIKRRLLLEKPAPLVFSLLHIPYGIEARLPERPESNLFYYGKAHGIT